MTPIRCGKDILKHNNTERLIKLNKSLYTFWVNNLTNTEYINLKIYLR